MSHYLVRIWDHVNDIREPSEQAMALYIGIVYMLDEAILSEESLLDLSDIRRLPPPPEE